MHAIDRFGPVGMAIELHQPAFVMKVGKLEEGSPAAATGKLKQGQIIESINGGKLKGIDPRIQLGQIIEAAEATDGAVKLMVRDAPKAPAQEVVVMIPVLGAYSKTWPLDCPKSDRIVRDFADYLTKPGSDKGFDNIGMLFLLATGEDKDLEPVREWARKCAKGRAPSYAWSLGFGGIPLCEYYLRTGEPEVLPAIQNWVDSAVKAQYLGGWAGRGGVAAVTYGGGGGHLNAAGTSVVTFLMLAKECGVNVPDHALIDALVHFFRFAGRGNNPYGDNRPEDSFVDNGKNGNLAFAMAAAASLTPEGEQSLYAAARDACAMTSFYTTTFMLHGHTGGGIGEIWRSAAMGLLADKKPKQFRDFMDQRKWHYELSRRSDGAFGILGGARYDNTSWGAGYALSYVIPRKTLRITGAPPSKFSKKYQLPERPWGTKADDVFLSLDAAADAHGNRQDLSEETLDQDSGGPLIERLKSMGDISDEVLRKVAHHQDILVRQLATRAAMGIEPNYMWIKSVGRIRTELVHEMMQSKDPRVRHAALAAMIAALRNEEPEKVVTQETFNLLIAMTGNSEESWTVKDVALRLIGYAPADWVAPHVDLLLPYLKHEEWWLQSAALEALAPVAADERCYQKVLPAVGDFLRTNQRWNASYRPMARIRAKLVEGSAAVQLLASATLVDAYTGFAGSRTAPGGQDITPTYDSYLEFLASTLATVEGGYDVLYKLSKERFPKDPLPYDKIFLAADPEDFGPELKQAIEPIILDKLVYEYIGKNWRRLMAEVSATVQNSFPVGSLDGLSGLYRKAGVNDHDWRPFGPDLRNAKWDYFSFDPPEQQKYDLSPWRYRPVTCPQGMEHWFGTSFNPEKAGWQKGQPPFGQTNGKLVTDSEPCGNPDCRHSDPMRSFWEKEVLLVRGTFTFPALKPGHLYRIRVGTGQHVGCGDGYKIYINGKPLIETERGVSRRAGGKPRGAYITQEFIEDFNKGEVTIAATTFLRYSNKASASTDFPVVPQGIFSLWVEEMKVPPLDARVLRKSASVIPMLSSEWQDKQDPDNAELQGGDDRFHYDGSFVANPKLLGRWIAVGLVADAEDFPSNKPANMKRASFKTLAFKDGGATHSETLIWSGDMLMDLNRYQALKVTTKTIGSSDYLFIENGGFAAKNPSKWKTQLIVMKRAGQ